MVLKIIKTILPSPLKKRLLRLRDTIFDVYAKKSYSQEGEDMVLQRIFDGKTNGFYVDVGAHHPFRFSNTYFFYRLGWSGINIEPNPEASDLFQSARRKDINLQLGVAAHAAKLKYYVFDEPALNTFDEDIVNVRLATTSYKVTKTIEIPVERLDNVLTKYLPVNQEIDFLSIDVEGLDFAVLESNDWKRFRPKCVLVEALQMPLQDAMNSDIFLFMQKQEYVLFAKTYNTLIFCSNEK